MFKTIRNTLSAALMKIEHQIKNPYTGDMTYPVRPPVQNICPGQNTFSL